MAAKLSLLLSVLLSSTLLGAAQDAVVDKGWQPSAEEPRGAKEVALAAADWRASVTNASIESFLRRAAAPNGAVIFTTFTMPGASQAGEGSWAQWFLRAAGGTCDACRRSHCTAAPCPFRCAGYESTVAMLKNFCYWLQKQGLMRHTVLLTASKRCGAAGLHCQCTSSFSSSRPPRAHPCACCSSWLAARDAGIPATEDRCLPYVNYEGPRIKTKVS